MEHNRSLTLLNKLGDLTITWDPDKDSDMEAIIQAQMNKGVKFFIIKPFSKKEIEIKSTADIVGRHLIVKDDDVLTIFNRDIVVEGVGKAITDNKVSLVKRIKNAIIETIKSSTNIDEIVQSHSIGVAPVKGG